MGNMSQKCSELVEFMRNEYIVHGYLYSGSWPYECLIEKGFSKEVIVEAQALGKLQKRNCEDYAFELPPTERIQLITQNSLCSVWYEATGKGLLKSIQDEARSAANIPENGNTKTVPTLKHEDDRDIPSRIEVSCSLFVGQIIHLEYGLPKSLRHRGFAGKKTGRFIVTDILHNMLVYPRMNMISVQSLDKEFNQIHPGSRTMLLFEDLVLKRLKGNTLSLEEQIQSAQSRSICSNPFVEEPAKLEVQIQSASVRTHHNLPNEDEKGLYSER